MYVCIYVCTLPWLYHCMGTLKTLTYIVSYQPTLLLGLPGESPPNASDLIYHLFWASMPLTASLVVSTSTPRTTFTQTSRRPVSATTPGSTVPHSSMMMTTPSLFVPFILPPRSFPMALWSWLWMCWPQSACTAAGRSLVFLHSFRRILYSVGGVRNPMWKQIKAMTKRRACPTLFFTTKKCKLSWKMYFTVNAANRYHVVIGGLHCVLNS